jgi:hypothetical protein
MINLQIHPYQKLKVFIQHTEPYEIVISLGNLNEKEEIMIPMFLIDNVLYFNSIGFKLNIESMQELSIGADSFVNQSSSSLWTELLQAKRNKATELRLKPLEIRLFAIRLLKEEGGPKLETN